MSKLFLFWMTRIPDPDAITRPEWDGFLDLLTYLIVIVTVIAGLMIVTAYERVASKKLIRRESDLFQPYTPLQCLWLCVVPAVLMFLVSWYQYYRRWPDAASFLGGALGVGLYTGFLTLVFAYMVMALTKATPPKFRYRPWSFVRGRI